jgi:uroporphyrinogen decarboxylase
MAWHLRGIEQILMDYCERPYVIEGFYEEFVRYNIERCRIAAEADVDLIMIGGDIAIQDRLLMSPKMWRAIDKPYLKWFIEEVRKVKPDILFYIHTDGNFMSILDDLIEIGFNILDSIQPEAMEPVEVKKRVGSRAVLHGCGSVQKVIPFGSVEVVREHVNYLIRNCAWDGGLVLTPSSTIQFGTPLENIFAFYETAREFDLESVEPPEWANVHSEGSM